MKFTYFKHILALPTHGQKSLVLELQALKKWKMEPGHPVLQLVQFLMAYWNMV